MKVIINAEPDDMDAVLKLIMERRSMFTGREPRLGWGWVFSIPSGKQYFLREIKDGISAAPAKP